jgi:hypothetical protein
MIAQQSVPTRFVDAPELPQTLADSVPMAKALPADSA